MFQSAIIAVPFLPWSKSFLACRDAPQIKTFAMPTTRTTGYAVVALVLNDVVFFYLRGNGGGESASWTRQRFSWTSKDPPPDRNPMIRIDEEERMVVGEDDEGEGEETEDTKARLLKCTELLEVISK